MIKKFVYSWCFLITVMFLGCSPGLHYSEEAYQRDTNIETKVLQVLKNTSDSYTTHTAEIEAIKTDIDNALATEKERKGNQVTVKMWEAVQQDKGNLYDLFQLWKTNDKLSPAIADDISKKVERLLGSITELEAYKVK
ncbi:MAG: hypothetical protein ABIO55_12815 [Ginsengibacter sp.]